MVRDTFLDALLFVVSLVSLVFALGEQFGWWDELTGRAIAKIGVARLYSAEGYPKTWIYSDRSEDQAVFDALEKRINRHTSNKTVRNLASQGNRPWLITVGGSPFQLKDLKPGWKSAVYSDVHPVMYIYKVEGSEMGNGKAARVATLGELSKWLENEQANRRFWVISVLIGILSLVVLTIRLTVLGN